MTDCYFCNPDNMIAETRLAYLHRDNYPAAPGHLEVVPRRHVASFFDLTTGEWSEMLWLAQDARRVHDGYTVGINDGPAAGQTVPHVHMHLIPRTLGDVPNPRGGIRRIFPDDEYSRSTP